MAEISIIIPVYNVEKYLRRCIDSITKQSFQNFEIILVDDGSTDSSAIICDEYCKKDARIIAIHKKNGGLSDARNIGIEYALQNLSSEWIVFVDSDDWVDVDFLKFLYMAAVEKNTKISMCGLLRCSEVTENFKKQIDYSVQSPAVAYTNHYSRISSSACGKLFKKELFSNVRFPKGRIWEDYYTIYKPFFYVDRISVVNLPLYYHYINTESISRRPWYAKKIDWPLAYEKELIPFFKMYKDKKMYRFILYDYIKALSICYYSAREAGDKKSEHYLLKQIRKSLLRYGSLVHFDKNDKWIYLSAVPALRKIKGYK